MSLVQPIVGMAATPDGAGYYLVASDGGLSRSVTPLSRARARVLAYGPGRRHRGAPGGYWIAYGQTAAYNSPLGQEELLAGLGYMPLSWSPLGFQWLWGNNPPQLTAMWSPGNPNMILTGAIWAFEAVHGMAMDGQISNAETGVLLGAANNPSANMNPNGYTYSLAQENSGTPQPNR